MTTDTSDIISRLEGIQAELEFLKQHIVDADLVLTTDDRAALRASKAAWKAGKTKRLA